jgi:hypothetical protein
MLKNGEQKFRKYKSAPKEFLRNDATGAEICNVAD